MSLFPQWRACVCTAGHSWGCLQGRQRGCNGITGAERPPSACRISTHLHWHPGASLHHGLLPAHCQVCMTGAETVAWTQIFTLKTGGGGSVFQIIKPDAHSLMEQTTEHWWICSCCTQVTLTDGQSVIKSVTHYLSREHQLSFFLLHTHSITRYSFWELPSTTTLCSFVAQWSRLRVQGLAQGSLTIHVKWGESDTFSFPSPTA